MAIIDIISTVFCNLPLIILGILGLCLLVVLHEFGHLIFAKLCNVFVPSFSVGFGPRLIEKKIGETTYCISAIPLGGYVELAGAPEVGQGEQKFAHAKDDRSFNTKPYWQKLFIMLGGILFNIIFAYVALSFLSYMGSPCIGSMCQTKAPLIASAVAGGQAEKAGIKAGDTITAINGTATPTINDVTETLKGQIDKEVSVTVTRDGAPQELKLTVEGQKAGEQTVPRIGIFWQMQSHSFVQSLAEGWKSTWSMMGSIVDALKGLGKSREGLGGPLILITSLTQCAGMGMKVFLFMLAFISLNLAIFNLIPLPIFDGGQVLFYTIEAILGRPLSDKTREAIHKYTWLILIALVAYLTFKDIGKLTSGFFKK